MKDLAPCPFCRTNKYVRKENQVDEFGITCVVCSCNAPISTWQKKRTPTPDLGVAVAALKWSKKRIEYLQLMLGDRHDCEIRYIDEALKSLGGE